MLGRRPPRVHRPAARRWRPASATIPTTTSRSSSASWSTWCGTAQPVRMSKRAGTLVTLDDLVDAVGVDAARYALARYSIDSPIDVDLDCDHPAHATTTRSTTCSTWPPGPPRCSATRPRSGSSRGDGVRPRAADPREGDRPAQGAGRLPGRGGDRRRAARAAPHRPVPGGAGRRRTTGSTTRAGCCRGRRAGTEPHDLTTARLWLNEAARTVMRQRPRPARRLRAGADVGSDARARGRRAARRVGHQGPAWLRTPGRRQRAAAGAVAAHRASAARTGCCPSAASA